MTDWRREIEELHEFFADWIGGAVERSPEAFGRLERALAEAFSFITPSAELLDREAVLGAVRDAHGTRPGLRIRIRRPRLLHAAADYLVATYEEWQEVEGERTGRLSTVVFRSRSTAPNGLSWLHVHETRIEGDGA